MSISPPSDIILDVARAADPAALRAATARLQAVSDGGGKFEAALAATGPEKPAPVVALRPQPQLPQAIPTAYRDFEAMVLASLFTSALPEDDTMFGAGSAGDIWKSVFVQEIGKAVAARGGIGIAAALARDPRLTPDAATAAVGAGAAGIPVAGLLATLNLDDFGGRK